MRPRKPIAAQETSASPSATPSAPAVACPAASRCEPHEQRPEEHLEDHSRTDGRGRGPNSSAIAPARARRAVRAPGRRLRTRCSRAWADTEVRPGNSASRARRAREASRRHTRREEAIQERRRARTRRRYPGAPSLGSARWPALADRHRVAPPRRRRPRPDRRTGCLQHGCPRRPARKIAKSNGTSSPPRERSELAHSESSCQLRETALEASGRTIAAAITHAPITAVRRPGALATTQDSTLGTCVQHSPLCALALFSRARRGSRLARLPAPRFGSRTGKTPRTPRRA